MVGRALMVSVALVGAVLGQGAPVAAPLISPFQKGPVPFALLRQGWVEDVEAHRLFGTVARYAPDADVLVPDGSHEEGIGAIRGWLTELFAKYNVSVRLMSRVTSESGDLAYDSGTYSEDLVEPGAKMTLHVGGDYLTIYRRNGLQWSIVQQAWTGGSGTAAAMMNGLAR